MEIPGCITQDSWLQSCCSVPSGHAWGTGNCPVFCAGTFFLYLVSQHPEVEAGILAELDSLGLSITPERPKPRPLTYADLGKLTSLQATVKVLPPAASSLSSTHYFCGP